MSLWPSPIEHKKIAAAGFLWLLSRYYSFAKSHLAWIKNPQSSQSAELRKHQANHTITHPKKELHLNIVT